MTRLQRARALLTGSHWSPDDLGLVDWAILHENYPWRVAASLALDGAPARFTARLPFVTNTYPGNIFRDDGKYFRGSF